jgi:hypothetical protein
MDQLRKNAIWATFVMVAPPGSHAAVQAESRQIFPPPFSRIYLQIKELVYFSLFDVVM